MAESVADTWEDLEDSGELDKKLEQLVVQTSETTSEPTSVLQNDIPAPCLLEDCPGRTTYQPTVRILKRDSSAPTINNSVAVPSKPTRTLQEREAAYAEARLRILGSAAGSDSSDDEDAASSAVSSTDSPRSTRDGKCERSSSATSISSSKDKKDDKNILREPRGPDGTKGFSLSR